MLKEQTKILGIIGITICLISAYLMAFGEPIIGAEHTGISTIVLIVGIGLLGTGNMSPFKTKKKEKMANE
jgi:hypothetical protein